MRLLVGALWGVVGCYWAQCGVVNTQAGRCQRVGSTSTSLSLSLSLSVSLSLALSLAIYIYVCVCVHICIYIYVYIYMRVCVYIYIALFCALSLADTSLCVAPVVAFQRKTDCPSAVWFWGLSGFQAQGFRVAGSGFWRFRLRVSGFQAQGFGLGV